MKFFICLFALVAVAVALPQERVGALFTNDAIRQAQDSYLLPKDAQIQNVQEGIELAAYESIPGKKHIDLYQILGDQVPQEVINNLQARIDEIGQY